MAGRMLTLGTALPQGIKALGAALPWQMPILVASGLACIAACMILRLGPGAQRAVGAPTRLAVGAVWQAFAVKDFRAATLGYFGHMWELYAMWTLTPLLIAQAGLAQALGMHPAALAFCVIAAGAVGCVAGGSSAAGSAVRVLPRLRCCSRRCAVRHFRWLAHGPLQPLSH